MDVLSLTKIELHAHLSGSISRQCLRELWLRKQAKGELPLEDPLIAMPADKVDYDLNTFFPLFSQYIYALCDDIPSLRFVTNSVLTDFEQDGVVYLELRTTPRAIPSNGISMEDYVSNVLQSITDFNNKSRTLRTKLILSVDRRHDSDTAMEIANLALKYRTEGVVGIDLCGDPSVGDVSIFAPAFQHVRDGGLPITVHFAEIPGVTRSELLKLLSFQPARLGHVIYVPDDIKDEIIQRRLGLELCVSCNVQSKMITGTIRNHHFGFWRQTGCPIALSTDDMGVFGSPLSNEYALVASHFGLSQDELLDLAIGTIDIIFGDEREKSRLRTISG